MKKKPSIRPWPWIVVALLTTHVGLLLWAVSTFVRDPNSAVIPNYYEKAVNHDRIKAEQAKAMLNAMPRERTP